MFYVYEKPRGVIVLEGPDACGKTTLAKTIIENHGGRYIHLRETKTPVTHMWAAMRRAARFCQDELVIIDRLWASEQIYGTVYRHAVVNDVAAKTVLDMLITIQAVQVFCLPKVESCVERHNRTRLSRSELYQADERIAQVAQWYWHLLNGREVSSPSSSLLEKICNDGGLLAYCPERLFLYDVDSDGQFVVDVANAIVDKAMHPRCNQPN